MMTLSSYDVCVQMWTNVRRRTADAMEPAPTSREDSSALAPSASGSHPTARNASVIHPCTIKYANFILIRLGLGSKDNNECISRNGHGPCQGQCVNTHGSYRCSCDGMPGTTLAPDGHSCEDLDECRVNNGGCSHTCLNTLGSAFCACPEGYMLGDDWKTCEGIIVTSSSLS